MIDVPAGGTLTIGAPSLVLLVGPSGSGKSTLALDVPLEDCLARSASRVGRIVPEEAIRSQRADMDQTLAHLDGEGFGRVYRLDGPAMASVRLVRHQE